MRRMRLAVVGHVEWVEFVRVPRVPKAGEIANSTELFQLPAGGGGVAVVQLLKLGGDATLYTALGDDEFGHRAATELEKLGVRVETTFRPVPQRRAFTFIDDDGERTITTVGERMGPHAEDPLAWDELRETAGVYFVAGDEGALRLARRTHALVATSRVMDELASAHVQLDAVVGSAEDVDERYRPIEPPPRLVVATEGERGGTFETSDGERGRYDAAELPGPRVDTYGCGDSFAAGLTYGLASGKDPRGALEIAARCGAYCLTGQGPFEGQLRLTT